MEFKFFKRISCALMTVVPDLLSLMPLFVLGYILFSAISFTFIIIIFNSHTEQHFCLEIELTPRSTENLKPKQKNSLLV